MSNQLIQLVKSLSRNEKRYINLNLKTFSFDEKENQLLADFNKIERQLSLKKLKTDLVIDGNATRLFYKLLDILFNLYKEQLYDNENDNRLIKRSQILFHKRFYTEGVKHLNKVIYKGFSYSYLLRIEAIELKIKAAIKFVDVDYLKDQFEDDKNLLSQFSRYYFNLVEFESMWAIIKVESTTSYFYGTNNEFSKKYELLLSNEDNAFSPNAKIYFNQINAFLAVKGGKLDQAYKHILRAKEIFEIHKEIRDNHFNEYLRTIRNLCIVYNHQGKLNEAENLLDEIALIIQETRKGKAATLSNDIFTLMVLLRMDIIINNESIKANEFRLKDFEDELISKEEGIATDEKATAYFYLSLMNMVTGNYRKALKLVTPAIRLSGSVRKDIHHVAQMLEMVIHYYLGNTDLLYSKLASYKRFIEKNEVVFSFEKKLPKLLSTIFNDPQNSKHYVKLKNEIDQSLTQENKLVYKHFMPLLYLKPI
jgi:hypothetical protein